jgi:hypothetical protein
VNVESYVARSSMLINNRRPFQTAYSLSHSPWKKKSSNSFIFRDSSLRLIVCSVELVDEGKSFVLNEEVIEQESMTSDLVWFA